ncbi:hypothetical protein RB195_000656 [Necator americanus]|uniref:Reverse transcriptase domain-containing protein n=1 Tax=Necator americanus TaxID=51031 RepID=A0ABR1DAS3_NECAM
MEKNVTNLQQFPSRLFLKPRHLREIGETGRMLNVRIKEHLAVAATPCGLSGTRQYERGVGEQTTTHATVRNWFHRFDEENFYFDDLPYTEHPSVGLAEDVLVGARQADSRLKSTLQAAVLRAGRRNSRKCGDADEDKVGGCTIAVRNDYKNLVGEFGSASSRCTFLRLRDRRGRKIWIVGARAPTETAEDNSKDAFYDELNALMSKIPSQQVIIVRINANAKMGLEQQSDVLGKWYYPAQRMSDNGNRLDDLAAQVAAAKPSLFNFAIDVIMRRTVDQCPADIVLAPSGCPLIDLEYADDVAIFAENSTKLQHVVNLVSKLAAAYGLRLRPDKCKQMWIYSEIRVDGQSVELVDDFCYLGCTLKNNGSYERDVQQRCAKVTSAFDCLTKCLWRTGDRPVQRVLRNLPASSWKKPPGRKQKFWSDVVKEDLRTLDVDRHFRRDVKFRRMWNSDEWIDSVQALAEDREGWAELCSYPAYLGENADNRVRR